MIAFVLCLNSFGTGNAGTAALVGIAAVAAFVATGEVLDLTPRAA